MLPGFMGSMMMAADVPKAIVLIDRTAGTNRGDMTGNAGLAAAFNGVTSQINSGCANKPSTNNSWIGKSLAAPRACHSVVIYGSSADGFKGTTNPSMTMNLRGKQGGTAPSSQTDGTLIGTLTFTDTANESAGRTISSTDLSTLWDHLFVEIISATGSAGHFVAELELYAWE